MKLSTLQSVMKMADKMQRQDLQVIQAKGICVLDVKFKEENCTL